MDFDKLQQAYQDALVGRYPPPAMIATGAWIMALDPKAILVPDSLYLITENRIWPLAVLAGQEPEC